jgi:HSP20 family molecular chaperone IbpA
MTWCVQEDSEEGFDLSRTKPKYSIILHEEDYETEDDLPGFDKGPDENYDRDIQVETWDPWEPSYFFRIQ